VIPGSLSDSDVLLLPYCGPVIQVPVTNTLIIINHNNDNNSNNNNDNNNNNTNNNHQDNIYGAVITAHL